MSKTTLFMVSDDANAIEKAKTFWETTGVTVQVFSHQQWNGGIESPQFRQTLGTSVPSLSIGQQPTGDGGKVLPFPAPGMGGPQTIGGGVGHSAGGGRVATMNELESQAIQNAISQYRGNLTEAAKALGIGRATLYRKVKQYNIDPSAARKRRAA